MYIQDPNGPRWTLSKKEMADRIIRLEATLEEKEADLVIARTTEANLHDHIRKLQEDFGKANAKWLKAEMALRRIAEHPHCDPRDCSDGSETVTDCGHAYGHRCAAVISRKALEHP